MIKFISWECKFLTAMAPPSRTMIPARNKKCAYDWPKDPNKELKALTWPQNSRDPNLYKHLWMCWNKLSIEAPICKPKDPEKLVPNTKGHPQRSYIHSSAAQSRFQSTVGLLQIVLARSYWDQGNLKARSMPWVLLVQFMTTFCCLTLCIIQLRGHRAVLLPVVFEFVVHVSTTLKCQDPRFSSRRFNENKMIIFFSLHLSVVLMLWLISVYLMHISHWKLPRACSQHEHIICTFICSQSIYISLISEKYAYTWENNNPKVL